MHKSPALGQKDFARKALIEASSEAKVGNFIEVVEDGDGLATYLFISNQKGYVDWRWSVTIFQAETTEPATVTEIALIPGPNSLLAPAWVPWSERLADYKALQLELEKQAALDAEDAAEADDIGDIEASPDIATDQLATGDLETDRFTEFDDLEDGSVDDSAESTVTDSEPGEGTESDSKTAGRKPPRFLRFRESFKIKKARGKGQDPKD